MMNLPLPRNGTASYHDTPFLQPLHERVSQRWQQVPSTVRQAMHRTLGGRPLAPLPFNPETQFSRHQPERAVLHTESPSEDMSFWPSLPAANESTPIISHFPTPLGFVALLAAYRPTGGVVRADDLSRHVRSDEPGHLTNLARKLVSSSILSFSWRQTLWVPLFQFEVGSSDVKSGVARILDQLTGAFDSWEMAVWFVQPNSWLNGMRPLDMLPSRQAEVLRAAQADRFVAMG